MYFFISRVAGPIHKISIRIVYLGVAISSELLNEINQLQRARTPYISEQLCPT